MPLGQDTVVICEELEDAATEDCELLLCEGTTCKGMLVAASSTVSTLELFVSTWPVSFS
jgi:hypothetical protein